MKLSVMQENLARGLSVVSRAVSSRSTLPVLANVLLRTEDAGLKLTATNLEIGITYWVPGKIETDGATTVPARLLTDLVGSLPSSEKVDLELQGADTLHIRAGRFATHVKGIDADEFPTIQTAGERPTTRVSQKVLKRALDETVFAAASDEARPILTGVLARFEGSKLTLAAADNYRIAVRTIDILDPVEAASVVIPARALNELGRILADTDDPVELVLAQASNQVLFHLEGVDIVSRLIDGQFPNYQQVLPATHTTRAEIDREELLRAVRPAALIASSSANIVKLQVGGRCRGRRHGDGGGRRLHGRRRGDGRGRRDDDRVQRPLPQRRAGQRACGPVRARAQRAALAGRVPAGGRRRVRARRDARPDDLLTERPRTRCCRTCSRTHGRRPGQPDPPRALRPRPPRLRGARRGLRARPAARVGPQRGRQDEPARGDRPARLGSLPPHDRRRRARPLGPGAGPRRGARRAARRRPQSTATPSRWHSSGRRAAAPASASA